MVDGHILKFAVNFDGEWFIAKILWHFGKRAVGAYGNDRTRNKTF